MSKKRILCYALCAAALLAAAVFFIVKQSLKTEAPSAPETESSAAYQRMKNMTQEELIAALEQITDEQLIELANQPKLQLTRDRRKFDSFSVDFLEGENGYPGEMWYEFNIWLSGSVSSLEQAEEIAWDFAGSDSYSEYHVEYIGENDLYYQFRVVQGPFAYRINFYKDSVIKFTKGDSGYYGGKTHDSFQDVVFQKLDYETVLTVMDLENPNAFFRCFEETDRAYFYTQYKLNGSGGDWGIEDTVGLIKTVTKISKETGTIEIDSTVIKEPIPIPGTAQ